MVSKTNDADPFTVEIIQLGLSAIAEEMFASMARAAMSSVIYEVLDFGVAITDARGELASAGAGIPGFVGMLDPAVKAVIRKYGTDIEPGDLFVSNDPYAGGVSHINDVSLAMPVFHDGRIVAWVADKGHWLDMGGMAPGSLSPEAAEIFQEGLILPEVRLFAGGVANREVFDIVRANSRLPEQAIGDLWAGVSALRVGERRLTGFCRKYGPEMVEEAIRDYLDYGERVSLNGLRSLPKGCYAAEESMDDGRRIRVLVTVSEDAFIVDLRDNPPQDGGPLNSTRLSTRVSAQAVFKGVVAPAHWANAGSFRPLQVLTEPGTLFHARRPAAVGLYYENKIRSADLICKALAPHMPDRMPAGHFASICATLIKSEGVDGLDRTFIEPEVGGWGASALKDGENAQFSSSHGNTFNCPVEINEARNGIGVDSLSLNGERSGAGRYRGGKGIDLRYRILGARAWLTAGYTRRVTPPWGVQGGGEGSCNRLEVIGANESVNVLEHAANYRLGQDDIVRIVTANGGGFGDARARPAGEVLVDLRDGYIDRAEADETYGLREAGQALRGPAADDGHARGR